MIAVKWKVTFDWFCVLVPAPLAIGAVIAIARCMPTPGLVQLQPNAKPLSCTRVYASKTHAACAQAPAWCDLHAQQSEVHRQSMLLCEEDRP